MLPLVRSSTTPSSVAPQSTPEASYGTASSPATSSSSLRRRRPVIAAKNRCPASRAGGAGTFGGVEAALVRPGTRRGLLADVRGPAVGIGGLPWVPPNRNRTYHKVEFYKLQLVLCTTWTQRLSGRLTCSIESGSGRSCRLSSRTGPQGFASPSSKAGDAKSYPLRRLAAGPEASTTKHWSTSQRRRWPTSATASVPTLTSVDWP